MLQKIIPFIEYRATAEKVIKNNLVKLEAFRCLWNKNNAFSQTFRKLSYFCFISDYYYLLTIQYTLLLIAL